MNFTTALSAMLRYQRPVVSLVKVLVQFYCVRHIWSDMRLILVEVQINDVTLAHWIRFFYSKIHNIFRHEETVYFLQTNRVLWADVLQCIRSTILPRVARKVCRRMYKLNYGNADQHFLLLSRLAHPCINDTLRKLQLLTGTFCVVIPLSIPRIVCGYFIVTLYS